MFLTICTPTYNRAYTLTRLYNSLKFQTAMDFEWIVIDDGSNDNTRDIVSNWIDEGIIQIRYFYQKNSGKHIALNQGINLAKGKVFTCLDSDDWFKTNTVESIKDHWKVIEEREEIVGIISLDCYKNGKVIGTRLPEEINEANWINLQYNHKVKGDKSYFFKTNILNKYLFPNIGESKHMPPSYQYFMLSKDYNFVLLNEVTKVVEYMSDGISRNKYRKYIVAPDNFAFYRLSIMDLIPSFRRKIINAIHFNASLYIGKSNFKPKSLFNKILVYITSPVGYILSKYILYKNK